MGALLRCGLLMTLLILGSAESSRVFNFQVTYRGRTCAQDIIKKQLESLSFENQSGRAGDVSWELKNIQNRGATVPVPNLGYDRSSNKITGSLSGLGIDLRADYKAKQQVGWFPVSTSGSVDVKVKSVSFSFSARLANGPDGQPSSVSSATCSANVGSVDLHFRGSWLSWLINLFKGALESRVRGILNDYEDEICDVVKNAMRDYGSATLSTLKDVSLEQYLCVNLQHCRWGSCLSFGF